MILVPAMRIPEWVASFWRKSPGGAPALRPAAAPTSIDVVRASNEQPQSHGEIRAFVEQMRTTLNDELLDIVWNAQYRLLDAGVYSAMGKLVRPPKYDGRWQVIRYQTPGGRAGRNHSIICTVRDYVRQDGILCFDDRETAGYQPVDDRLLELMRSADAANVRGFKAIRDKLWRQHDEAEARESAIDEGEARAGLDHAHFGANYAGGVGNWMGKGADFKEMERAATSRRATGS